MRGSRSNIELGRLACRGHKNSGACAPRTPHTVWSLGLPLGCTWRKKVYCSPIPEDATVRGKHAQDFITEPCHASSASIASPHPLSEKCSWLTLRWFRIFQSWEVASRLQHVLEAHGVHSLQTSLLSAPLV